MRCPRLNDLPPAPAGRKGWPWTTGAEPMPAAAPDGRPWPTISIVTPSFNQGRFLEETIRSVLLQGYPSLEYIVMDGGSADDSVEIIRKYEPWLTSWTSAPDRGQSHAINQGFARAAGAVRGYINSDDLYEPGALRAAAETFLSGPEVHLVAGQCVIFEDGRDIRLFEPGWPETMARFLEPFGSTFAQPAGFWSRDIHARVEGFDPDLHYCFDREFFLKIGLAGVRPVLLNRPLARYRQHRDTKTNRTIRFYEETLPLIEKYGSACGLAPAARRRLERACRREIAYLKVFMTWKARGRPAAMGAYARMVLGSPPVMFQRKIAGQGRRLLFFPAEKVAELKNV